MRRATRRDERGRAGRSQAPTLARKPALPGGAGEAQTRDWISSGAAGPGEGRLKQAHRADQGLSRARGLMPVLPLDDARLEHGRGRSGPGRTPGCEPPLRGLGSGAGRAGDVQGRDQEDRVKPDLNLRPQGESRTLPRGPAPGKLLARLGRLLAEESSDDLGPPGAYPVSVDVDAGAALSPNPRATSMARATSAALVNSGTGQAPGRVYWRARAKAAPNSLGTGHQDTGPPASRWRPGPSRNARSVADPSGHP